MTVDITIPAGEWVRWRHFNHSDNASGASHLHEVAPDPHIMVPSWSRWPGVTGTLVPRPAAWTLRLDLLRPPPHGTPALHILDTWSPGPPDNHQGQYQDGAELASMTGRVWRIRWEAPWQGGGDPDYNDVYTWLWEITPEVGSGWTVGHVGVAPAP